MRKVIVLSFAALFATISIAWAQQRDDRYRNFKPSSTKQAVTPGVKRYTPSVNRYTSATVRQTPGVARQATPNAGSPRGPGNNGGGGYRGSGHYGGGGGWRGPGYGGFVPGVIMGLPGAFPPGAPSTNVVDDPDYGNYPPPGAGQPQRNAASRNNRPSGVPPANETRMVPDEVVIEVPNTISPQAVTALERRHRLARIESQTFQLSGTTLFRWRIPDRRSVAAVVRALENDGAVMTAQPNYLFTLSQTSEPQPAATAPQDSLGAQLQYFVGKLRLTEAHGVATGGNVTVAVIDSGIDGNHPELAGTIADSYDVLNTPFAPHAHGTAIAALIAGHLKLEGAAPAARLLAIRAFDPNGASAQATTFSILKGLDWAAAHNARVINMSFAGPADPAIHRALDVASRKGIVLIAAAGNDGPQSPPLYPAAEPNVIALSATDSNDGLFAQSNIGRHIAIAAPGVDIVVASPDGHYQVSSGTSYSAAEISGIVALMIERRPELTPALVLRALQATAKDLGPVGRDDQFGAGLADAYRAVTEELPAAKVSAATPRR